ncbi:hypothetical protein EXN66_Car015171 [Channa argus]|uniref:Uncharacterized protein n=1 Tax=Channa argus TaxID=215402 RepID=A0A6G1QAP0_CHAAH|nr:hypothetical protein EXN66_Car015171 [Channa argus]
MEDKGHHGHSEQSAATQPHTQKNVVLCTEVVEVHKLNTQVHVFCQNHIISYIKTTKWY